MVPCLRRRGKPGHTCHEGTPGRGACIMEMYPCWHGAWHDYFQSYTWQSLGNAVQQCGLEFDGKAHSALADAKAALAILRFMAGEY